MRLITESEIEVVSGGDDIIVIGATMADASSVGDGSAYGGGAGAGHNTADRNYSRNVLGQQKYNFFRKLEPVCEKIAADLHIPVEYVMALAAYESGYFGQHAQDLNNPFGLTQGGGKDLSFASLADAGTAFEKATADRFAGGVNSVDQFIADLGKEPAYNSVNPNYDATMRSIIKSVTARKDIYDRYN